MSDYLLILLSTALINIAAGLLSLAFMGFAGLRFS
jgi:Na+-translocating ferredoxin:NAD+ oxidoreductase RnfA subunit